MLEDLYNYIGEIEIILREIDRYKTFKKQFLNDIKRLNRQYEAGSFEYLKYKKLKDKLLDGKTKKEIIEYYNSYILILVKKLEYLNSQCFNLIYKDISFEKLLINKVQKIKKISLPRKKITPQTLTDTDKKTSKLKKGKTLDLSEEHVLTEKNKSKHQIGLSKDTRELGLNYKPVIELGQDNFSESERYTLKKDRKYIKQEIPENAQILGGDDALKNGNKIKAYDALHPPKPFKRKFNPAVPNPEKKDFLSVVKSILGEESQDFLTTKEKGLWFGNILNLGFIKDFISRITSKEKFVGKDNIIGKSLLNFEKIMTADLEKESNINPNLLAKQATHLKSILNKSNIEIYNPSLIGTFSNLLVRKLSIRIIDSFPNFFKEFYTKLRFANVKILSNTYINIMILLSIISTIIFASFNLTMGIYLNYPLYLIISKTFLYGILGGVLVLAFMIYYPQTQIKKRRKSINTNLPFAIDHMSSLVASGVPPATMFKLFASTNAYGEVSKEIEKISNYIEIFGYDMTTAMKSVSSTTPSPILKEFLDGLVSTIDSGGSLNNYLYQKLQDAMLSYRLERQKYVESISTYSDIYTGVLIAAPLFFISALSLVSILGGKIGAMEVDTVIAFGTYFVIPILNMLFLVFLELNQPEI